MSSSKKKLKSHCEERSDEANFSQQTKKFFQTQFAFVRS